MSLSIETRLSLLDGLKNSLEHDRFEESWRRFNEKYTPRMLNWALRMGLNRTDAEEVCQDLMVRLLRRLKTLPYDPARSFRGWLKTVTRNAVLDFLDHRKRDVPTESDTLQVLLDAKPIEEQLDLIFRNELLEEARSRVELQLSATEAGWRNWQIFLRLEMTDIAPDQLATEFGIRKQAVYVAKGRVLEALRQEVKRLEGEPESF